MGTNPGLPPKKDVALALLERSTRSTVFVYLDPRHETVSVPPRFKRQPQLVLQIGLNMQIPILDLDLSDEAITCTLSFNGAPHFCRVPWQAVWALSGDDGRGMIWPDDVPKEVATQTRMEAPKPKAQLRAVDPNVASAGEAGDPKPKAKRPRKRRQSKAAEVVETAEVTASAAEPSAEAAPALTEPVAGSAGSPARKRALPPYLRVIK